MEGRADYVVKRTLFALLTVFVAVTINFLLFRALPGDAVSGLRCQHCTLQFKAEFEAGFFGGADVLGFPAASSESAP